MIGAGATSRTTTGVVVGERTRETVVGGATTREVGRESEAIGRSGIAMPRSAVAMRRWIPLLRRATWRRVRAHRGVAFVLACRVPRAVLRAMAGAGSCRLRCRSFCNTSRPRHLPQLLQPATNAALPASALSRHFSVTHVAMRVAFALACSRGGGGACRQRLQMDRVYEAHCRREMLLI